MSDPLPSSLRWFAHGIDEKTVRKRVLAAFYSQEDDYQGRLDAIDDSRQGNTIILREKTPWQGVRGKWARTYASADGHSEIHVEPDGDFTAWESERIPHAP